MYIELWQRVAAYIQQHQLLQAGSRVIVGLSGGVDSMVLLDVLLHLTYDVRAAHCNFCLRGDEANRDEQFVRDYCSAQHIPWDYTRFDTLRYAHQHGLSTEMAARNLRYAWFEQLREQQQAAAIAVAHHQDDSVETVLLNLLQGTGLHGLTGIQARSGRVVRPLLCLSRKEIESYADHRGLPHITDSTNVENAYKRNKVRNLLLPLLEEIQPDFRQTFLHNMDNWQQADQLCSRYITEKLQQLLHTAEDGSQCINRRSLLAEPDARLLLFAWLHPYHFHPAQLPQILACQRGGACFHSPTHDVTLHKGSYCLRKKLHPSGTVL